MTIPDHARVKSESIGPILTEIDLMGGHGVKKFDILYFNMGT